jgi:hypothetical protein
MASSPTSMRWCFGRIPRSFPTSAACKGWVGVDRISLWDPGYRYRGDADVLLIGVPEVSAGVGAPAVDVPADQHGARVGLSG